MEDFIFTTCCFTGHRPNKFPWGYSETDERCISYKQKIKEVINELYLKGIRWFIIGGAQGFDTWVGEEIIELKKAHSDVIFEIAIPCRTQDALWTKKAKERYQNLIDNANKLTIISHEYTNTCMQQRNDYMLRKSSIVVAGYIEGVSGGTSTTIKKAQKQNKETDIIPIN